MIVRAALSHGTLLMSEVAKVLVWLPLPPQAKWRGEGIAQTLEQILLNLPLDIKVCLVVSGHHFYTVRDVFKECPNIVVRTTDILAWILPKRTRKWVTFDEISASNFGTSARGRIMVGPLLEPARRFFNRLSQVFPLYLIFLQRWGMVFRGYSTLWFPTATLPFLGLLRGRKIFSFWDPFVFEYNEFDDIQARLIKRFLVIFSSADLVITQSRVNRTYLTSVFSIPLDRIKVVNNGAPDYSRLWADFQRKLPAGTNLRERDNMITYWPPFEIVADNPLDAFDQYAAGKINHSKLFRLAFSLNSKSKIIFVSTQYRPYKGFATLLQLFDKLIAESPDLDLRFVFTTSIPKLLINRFSWCTERVYEISRVSDIQHAYLYAISDLVLHPSLVEGGLGTYPQFEAASLNVPSLNNFGRHVSELADSTESSLDVTIADFSAIPETVKKIRGLLLDPQLVESNVAATRNARLEWKDAARRYAEVFRAASHDQ